MVICLEEIININLSNFDKVSITKNQILNTFLKIKEEELDNFTIKVYENLNVKEKIDFKKEENHFYERSVINRLLDKEINFNNIIINSRMPMDTYELMAYYQNIIEDRLRIELIDILESIKNRT